jgi:SAM-dependent methyltransferase
MNPATKVVHKLMRQYIHYCYYRSDRSINLWSFFCQIVPYLRNIVERKYRSLPRYGGEFGLLLDVGCGDGTYLDLIEGVGWRGVGIDFDGQAIAAARSRGLTVHEGDIAHFDGQSDVFDVITLSHVIEHVPDPNNLLASCYRLLRPGGQIWIETPNINSFGSARFGANWRGLEAPRHLVLFEPSSLRLAVEGVGFQGYQYVAGGGSCLPIYRSSHAMRTGYISSDAVPSPLWTYFAAILDEVRGIWTPLKREFMTVVARKPSG